MTGKEEADAKEERETSSKERGRAKEGEDGL
jgi:hypothetical protein